MVDRDFDRLVLRTSMRPLATGALSLFYALAVMACLLLGALLVFWQLNRTAQTLALVNALFVFPYPWLKRFFNFPQLYLGLIFNGGVWVGFAQLGSFSYGVLIPLCLLYGSGIAWTLIYDTIYALQDVQDDEKIGLLSTALFFERRPRFFLLSCTLALLGLLWLLGWYYGFGIVYKSGLLISAVFLGVASLIAQKMALSNLSRLFSLCQLVGWLITLTLLIGFWMLRSP
jgi:4-hydroxybenzoate polyprenyl transferase